MRYYLLEIHLNQMGGRQFRSEMRLSEGRNTNRHQVTPPACAYRLDVDLPIRTPSEYWPVVIQSTLLLARVLLHCHFFVWLIKTNWCTLCKMGDCGKLTISHSGKDRECWLQF